MVSLSAQILRYFLDLRTGQPKDQWPHEPCQTVVADTVTDIEGLVDQISFVLAGKDGIAVPHRHVPVDPMADRAFVLAIEGLTVEGARLSFCYAKFA